MTNMRVGIIGAGITGSYLAMKLALQGHDVTVFEKNKTIGNAVCSGLISERLWEFIPKEESIILHKLSHVNVNFPDKIVKVHFNPRMMVVDREKLDRYVATLAHNAGVKFMLGTEFVKLFNLGNSRPQISVKKDGKTLAFEFDYLIGCDGPESKVRKQLKLKDPNMRLGIYVYGGKRKRINDIDVWPVGDGFNWRIPRGVNIEYGTMGDLKDAKKEFQKFIRKNKVRSKETFASLIPEGLIITNHSRIALCGDAAGLTKPWSGGGVIWHMKTATIMSQKFPNINAYNRSVRNFFEPRIFFSKIAEKVGMFIGNRLPGLVPSHLVIDSDWVF